MASFNGESIFGVAVTMTTPTNPREVQETSYAGVSGVESKNLGGRGRWTMVSGQLVGSSKANLALAEGIFRSYDDGRAYTLLDTLGTAWPFVMLKSFEPTGPSYEDSAGVHCRNYSARFRHLL